MSFSLGWHLLDIFFMLVGCYFVIRGAFRGFIGEALSLGGLIFSVYVGFKYSDSLGNILGSAAGLNKGAAQVLAVILVWLVMSILFSLLQKILRKILDIASLGGVDRILGIFCGALKTIVVIYAVLIGGLLLAPVAEPTWMSHSDTLVFAGRKWPEVRRLLIGVNVLPRMTELPGGTLEQILGGYRRGLSVPGAAVTGLEAPFVRQRGGDGAPGI